jgi:hypothetical protein
VVRLIAALRRLARRQQAADQPREALGAARRALAESQRLMDMSVAEAPAEVAASLRELASYLALAGQDREADAIAMQAVEAYRALADGDLAYLRPLAQVGIDLSQQRMDTGNPLGARMSARDATAAAERIVSPAESDLLLLDRAREQLDLCQARLGEDDERLPLAQTRVAMWRALAAENPRHGANLGRALRSLAEVRARRSLELRRAAATEAVTIFEGLARQDQAYEAELVASRRTLAGLGRWRIILGRVQRQPA